MRHPEPELDERQAAPPPTGAAAGRRRRPAPSPAAWAVAATTLGLVPFLVILVRVVAADLFAIHGDGVLIEMRVRDVGSADTPLLGSYQRFGWNMPGPLFFYLLAVPYRLLGSDFAGLQVGAVLIHAAAFVGVAATVFRRFGAVPTVWAVALLSVLVHALGPQRLADPWEPLVTVLPFVLFLVLAATMASGSARAMPFAVGVGTFLAQAQATLAPTVVALLLVGGAALAGSLLRRHRATGAISALRAARRPLLATAVVLAVTWFPPLLHELTSAPSNVAAVADWLGQSQPTLGPRAALSTIALQFDHRAGWITGEVPLVFGAGTLDLTGLPVAPVPILVLVAATAVAARRRDSSAVLGAFVLLGFGFGLVALSRLVGELFVWIVYWTWGLGMAAWLAAGICAWRSLPAPWRRRAEHGAAAALTFGVVALAAMTVGDADEIRAPDDRVRRAVLEMADDVEAALPDADGPVLVRSELLIEDLFVEDDVGVEFLSLALERAGPDVRVSPHLAFRFGDHRATDDATTEVVLVSHLPASPGPGTEVVGPVALLTAAEAAELEDLTDELRAEGLEGATREEIPDGPDHDIRVYQIGRASQLASYLPISALVRDLPD